MWSECGHLVIVSPAHEEEGGNQLPRPPRSLRCICSRIFPATLTFGGSPAVATAARQTLTAERRCEIGIATDIMATKERYDSFNFS